MFHNQFVSIQDGLRLVTKLQFRNTNEVGTQFPAKSVPKREFGNKVVSSYRDQFLNNGTLP